MKKLFCFCLLIVFTFSFAQDGSPDLSFGNNGVVIHQSAGDDHLIRGVDEKSNGKILALILTSDIQMNNPERIFAFNEDGSMDTDFGNNGILDISNPNINFNGLRVLPDDSFFLIGYSNSVFTILKYDEAGILDSSFGNGGMLQPFASGGTGSSMIVNDDQTLFFLGSQTIAGVTHILFLKYLENGFPDNTFGNNGMALYSLGTVTNVFSGFQKVDDFFYLGIRFHENNVTSSNIYRFHLNGVIDNTFGTNGRIIIPIEEEYATILNVFNDGNILVGGFYWDMNTESVVRKTIKINSQGQLIQSFGNGGLISGFTGDYIQGNQRFILDGTHLDWEEGTLPFFIRYFSNGNYDSGFQFSSNYNELGSFSLKHLQSGKILIVGSDYLFNGPDIKISLQRFNNNPLSVSEFEKRTVAVYPNPSSGIFQVHNNFLFNNDSYVIFDSLGQKVLSGQFNDNFPSIDLGNFAVGVYFLKIENIPQTIKLLKK